MKKLFLGTILTLVSSGTFASVGVYYCKLDNGRNEATLVYYPDRQSIDWMPSSGLKTTKANAQGRLLDSGELQFNLFGFLDHADILILPKGASDLPAQMSVYTYHDHDDLAEDTQRFTCKQ